MTRALILMCLLGGCTELPPPPVSAVPPPIDDIDADLGAENSDADRPIQVRNDLGPSVRDAAVDAMGQDADRSSLDGSSSSDGTPPFDANTMPMDGRVDGSEQPDATIEIIDGPARYPAGQIHSPITAHTRAVMAEIAAVEGTQDDQVFMKIGASSTVSRSTLHCFAGDTVDLGDAQDLQMTLDYFLGGDAGGDTPFDRVTLAARVGHSAGWATAGDPSPIDNEIAAIDPRLAIVHYGTNDMALVGAYRDGLIHFYGRMMLLIEELVARGIVPILTGITRRGDNARANLWVHTFNAAIRGMAQKWQVPFIDLHLAVDTLNRHGLSGDGLHLNGYPRGACLLTEEGLEYGYNVRNLIVLTALDRVRRTLFTDQAPLDPPLAPLPGNGTSESPYEIETLPFSDSRDTTQSGHSRFDEYGCDDADESGPEYVYRFQTAREIRLRAVVLDRDGVDIDLHLLGEDGLAEGCLDRGHHEMAFTLAPGTYHFVLDSWVDGDGDAQSGAYLFLLVECDEGDDACAGAP